MGAGGSALSPEVFAGMKDAYEAKKSEGVSDEELFDHMKNHYETISSKAKPAEEAAATAEPTVAAAESAPVVENTEAPAPPTTEAAPEPVAE